jgi:hypothetical protein
MLLLCAAGALCLLAREFAVRAGRAAAQDVPRKAAPKAKQPPPPKAAKDDPINQQFEQQFGRQFRQLYKSELHFMRVVCQPTKQQYQKIAADGEASLKVTVKQFAEKWQAMQQGRGATAEQSDPRTPIVEGLAKSVGATLSAEQAAQYRKELDLRAAALKRLVVTNLLVMVDKALALTDEQRGKVGAVLEKNWKEGWSVYVFQGGGRYFPAMPDAQILPLLTETQKTVWQGTQRGNVHFGFYMGWLQFIDGDEEVWDEERPNPEPADGKPAAKKAEKK